MREQLHILFISSWYPNRKQPIHGIFNRYFALAASRYNKVSVLNIVSQNDPDADYRPEITQEPNLLTVNVFYEKVEQKIPFYSQWQRRKKVFAAAEKGMEIILNINRQPQLMQLNVVMPMGVVALHIANKFNLPFVVNENWSGYTKEDGNYRGLIHKYFTKRVIAKAKKIMPTSSYLQKAMQSHNLNGDYQVVPNPVNTDVFKPSENTAARKGRFIHISSLNDREKNVSGLIRAFAEAAKKEKIELLIVGEGVDKDNYVRLVEELKLENKVRFAGKLMADALVTEINQSEALIMFSNYETFCLVNIEAFACGKPVITSAAGAIPTYMLPELGIQVPIADEKALTLAITSFIKNNQNFNPEFIRRYAVQNFSYEKVGRDLDEIYHNVLEK